MAEDQPPQEEKPDIWDRINTRLKLATQDVETMKYKVLSFSSGLDEPGVTFWQRNKIAIYFLSGMALVVVVGYLLHFAWLYIPFGLMLLISGLLYFIKWGWGCMKEQWKKIKN